MSTNLPVEWKAALEGLAPIEVVKRVEGLIVRGQTAPLPAEKEIGPFLLYALGDTIEEVAQKTGIPVDIIYLTAITFRWTEKRNELSLRGNSQLIAALQKQLVNNLLVATQLSVIKQVGEVMSGKLAPEKCSLIPRSLHGLKALLDMVTDMNKLAAPTDAPPAGTTTIIHSNQVQINQGVPPSPAIDVETPEQRRQKFLAAADEEPHD